MTEQIQLSRINNLKRVYADYEEHGLYIIQFENAIECNYPDTWLHSHKEWLGVARYGLIKIGIARHSVQERIRSLKSIAYNDYESPAIAKLRLAGYANIRLKRTYEKWLHETLGAFRIPQSEMRTLGREWFIPSDEVLAFLGDTLNTMVIKCEESDEFSNVFERLARIRQFYFGGILTPPIKIENFITGGRFKLPNPCKDNG